VARVLAANSASLKENPAKTGFERLKQRLHSTKAVVVCQAGSAGRASYDVERGAGCNRDSQSAGPGNKSGFPRNQARPVLRENFWPGKKNRIKNLYSIDHFGN
jgi:hypothetical protein